MGVFSKKSGKTNQHSVTTIISSGCRINGTIQLACDIQIDGKVDGKIISEKVVVISQDGYLTGEIFAEKIIVNGFVEGNCFANHIEVLAKGKITGSAYSDNLSIEQGGGFFGDIHPMDDQPASKIEKIMPRDIVSGKNSVDKSTESLKNVSV